jgi:hypothetical protein
VVRGDVQVREIAASTAGDADLGARSFSMVDHQDRPAALAAFDSTQKARCSGADYDNVFFHLHRITGVHCSSCRDIKHSIIPEILTVRLLYREYHQLFPLTRNYDVNLNA